MAAIAELGTPMGHKGGQSTGTVVRQNTPTRNAAQDPTRRGVRVPQKPRNATRLLPGKPRTSTLMLLAATSPQPAPRVG